MDETLEIDYLSNITQIGLSKAKELLSKFIGEDVKISAPKVMILSSKESEIDFGIGGYNRKGAVLDFNGTYKGSAYLLFGDDNLMDIVAKTSNVDFSKESLSDLLDDMTKELANIVLNGIVGTISNIVNGMIKFHLPDLIEGRIERIIQKGFSQENEVCFIGMGLFTVPKMNITGLTSFVFYFDEIDSLLSSVKNFKASQNTTV